MELTTTRAYVILDTLEATVPLTMTTVAPLLVFMVSDGLNLKQKWNRIVLHTPWVIFYNCTILQTILTRKLRLPYGKNDQSVLYV